MTTPTWLWLFALLILAACDLLIDPGAPVTSSSETTVVMAPLVPSIDTGLTWTRIDVESPGKGPGDLRISEVTVGGPGLVAVGVDTTGAYGDSDSFNDAAVWVSVDGYTWTRIRDDAVFGGPEQQQISSVTAGGAGLVAVGAAGPYQDTIAAVWVSADGYTWTRLAHDEDVFGGPGNQRMHSVIAGGPGLVAVGSEGSGFESHPVVWVSPDGFTWTRLPNDEDVFGGPGNQRMHSVTAGGPGLVATGSRHLSADPFSPAVAVVWVSADGYTWTRIAHDEDVFGGNSTIGFVTAGGPGLVAGGSDGSFEHPGDAIVWASADGYTWARIDDPSVFGGPHQQQIGPITVGGPGLIAAGIEHTDLDHPDFSLVLWVSDDGYVWSRVAHDEGVFSGPADQVASLVTWGSTIVAAGTSKGVSQDAVIWLAKPTVP